jgi:hypothetical protein
MTADPILRVVIAGARAGVEPGATARRAGGPEALLQASARRLDRLGVPAGFQVELRHARTTGLPEGPRIVNGHRTTPEVLEVV